MKSRHLRSALTARVLVHRLRRKLRPSVIRGVASGSFDEQRYGLSRPTAIELNQLNSLGC